jgi:glycosyltransferase involved in cell wall biosynthesis
MDICWITQIDQKTFHKTSRIELANALRERGHSVTLIIQRNVGEHPSDKQNISLPTFSYSIISRVMFNLLILFYLPFKILRKKTDIVMIDGGNVYPPFVLVLKLLGHPLIMDLRTLPTGEMKTAQSFFFDSSMYLSKLIVNGYTAITPEVKKILIQKYRIEDAKIGIWTSGVSLKSFTKPTTTSNETAIQKDAQCLYLMNHGKYSRSRGMEDLINGIGHVDPSIRSKIKLIVVGTDCDTNSELHKLIHKLNLQNNIMFIPPVPHEKIPAYIDNCDVGVIPLPTNIIWWRVSAPLKTLEYLGMGKPIIATDIPFHREIFEKGECGVLVKDSEPATIAKAIEYLYNHKDKLNDMGKKAREIVEHYYTWEKSAQDLETFMKIMRPQDSR